MLGSRRKKPWKPKDESAEPAPRLHAGPDAGQRVARIVNLINDAYRWSEAEWWVNHKERTNNLKIDALIESGMIILAHSNDDIAGVAKIEEVAPEVG